MNKAEARAKRSPLGFWVGEYRFVHKADFYQVTDRGEPARFQTSIAAELAAHKAVLSHLNGHMNRSGEKSVMDAERAFGAVFKNGQRIPVEVKGTRCVKKR